MSNPSIAILGGGNIGIAIANGLVAAGSQPGSIYITRRNPDMITDIDREAVCVTNDNVKAVTDCQVIILAVRPLQIPSLIDQIRDHLEPKRHILLSVASGVSIEDTLELVQKDLPVVRVMPNTAIAVRESMTCLAARTKDAKSLEVATQIFQHVGETIIIEEELFTPATALCACGTAFFLRAIRAASQGGIQIGFHSEEALKMAAQTAKGAACLVLESGNHPEREIDKVTTPRGCTIAGLNQMEHEGFSSALIKGFVTSSDIAGSLYSGEE